MRPPIRPQVRWPRQHPSCRAMRRTGNTCAGSHHAQARQGGGGRLLQQAYDRGAGPVMHTRHMDSPQAVVGSDHSLFIRGIPVTKQKMQ